MEIMTIEDVQMCGYADVQIAYLNAHKTKTASRIWKAVCSYLISIILQTCTLHL